MTDKFRGVLRFAAWVSSVAGLVSACATHGPAPVSERTAPAPRAEAPVKGSRDHYVVRKGDTLYSIAREVGREPRDIAAWNNLDAPGALRIGQMLRITPPEGPATAVVGTGAAVSKPIAGPAEVEVKPLSGPGPSGTAEAPRIGGDSVKREPRGGKQPYSEQALVALQRRDGNALRPLDPSAARTEVRPESRPESKPEAKPDAKADSKPEAAPKVGDGENGIVWGWPGGGKVLVPFDEPNSKGLDIAGRPGESILAAASGKVVYVGAMRGYGNLVIVKHSGGFVSAYANNRKNLVREGQTIAKGQKLAEMGDGADSREGKLHFQIRQQGKALDPMKYLPTR